MSETRSQLLKLLETNNTDEIKIELVIRKPINPEDYMPRAGQNQDGVEVSLYCSELNGPPKRFGLVAHKYELNQCLEMFLNDIS